MNPEDIYKRYQELQRYVGWTDEDAGRVHAVGPLLAPHFASLIDDFYAEIARHPDARKVITSGAEQIERLKGTLRAWIADLFTGKYDTEYVYRRWRVGYRHVEIGLEQVYTNVALSRLRSGLIRVLGQSWPGSQEELIATLESLNKLLDLDLAKIEDAYQTEYVRRQQNSERLAAIGQVAGGVAHELRNPLNVIKTSVYYLLNARQPTEEKKAEHLQRIERHVLLADGVITALSGFAKMPVPSLKRVSLRQLIREALEITPMPAGIAVRVECADDVPAALADPAQLHIVVGNLLRNAREAMPKGGQLTLRCRSSGENVEVAIEDTGTGISKENLSRIMEPLYSTKAKGLGLGLALARAILEKNNGSLQVESAVGKGSTFTFRLSAAIEEDEP